MCGSLLLTVSRPKLNLTSLPSNFSPTSWRAFVRSSPSAAFERLCPVVCLLGRPLLPDWQFFQPCVPKTLRPFLAQTHSLETSAVLTSSPRPPQGLVILKDGLPPSCCSFPSAFQDLLAALAPEKRQPYLRRRRPCLVLTAFPFLDVSATQSGFSPKHQGLLHCGRGPDSLVTAYRSSPYCFRQICYPDLLVKGISRFPPGHQVFCSAPDKPFMTYDPFLPARTLVLLPPIVRPGAAPAIATRDLPRPTPWSF